ncbi:hypothetical protein H2203_008161 [Taxawa tesnikishii (nom. ined.)]|nr:hypothetical protein H2203_008161 [Dothideales sp. JES 119]
MISLSSAPNSRFIHLIVGAAILTTLGWFVFASYSGPIQEHIPFLHNDDKSQQAQQGNRPRHPIDTLVRNAEKEHKALLAKETHNLYDAAQAYEARRGRRPPPGFDLWFDFAQEHNAIIVEEFFDRIYDDLNPFGLCRLCKYANKPTTSSTASDLVGTISEYLPDLDMAINEMDESRVIVPWETIDGYVQQERAQRKIISADDAITRFTSTVVSPTEEVPKFDPEFHGGNYWDLAVIGCPLDSPARTNYVAETNFELPPPLPSTRPVHSHKGFVSNWTLTKSPCDNPTLQQLHGTFVEPISISNSKKLFPLFGGSKLPMNNEILLPPAMYWTDDPFYSGGKGHGSAWEEKQDKIIWRGAASGGRNKKENWTRFQRHRFIAMVNGTSVKLAETSDNPPPNIELPAPNAYNLTAMHEGFLGDWVGEIADAAVVHLLCFPDPNPPHCDYTDPWYEVKKSKPMQEQYGYKYLPDIDGNSFSGRYRGFLGSTSLPIKATIYDEWHDSRLVAWKHFVPMDNTFIDIYGIMEYFLGYNGKNGHDEVAKGIALLARNGQKRCCGGRTCRSTSSAYY